MCLDHDYGCTDVPLDCVRVVVLTPGSVAATTAPAVVCLPACMLAPMPVPCLRCTQLLFEGTWLLAGVRMLHTPLTGCQQLPCRPFRLA